MAWLTSLGTAVELSSRRSSTILFCRAGVTVRQLEAETVKEYRALDRATAKNAVGVSDSTVQTTYYRKIGGVIHSISVLSGSRTEKTAGRTNEADGWRVTERTVTYTVDPAASGSTTAPSGWSTSLAAADTDGRTVSQQKSAQHVASANYEYSGARYAATLMSVKTVTVKEYTGLTAAQKDAKLANATSGVTQHRYKFVYTYSYTSGNPPQTNTGTAVGRWATANLGTNVYCTASLGADGWTVTETTETYTAQQYGQRTGSYYWADDGAVQ